MLLSETQRIKMQSKSLIARVLPESLPLFVGQAKKEIRYYIKYHSEVFNLLAIFLLVGGIFLTIGLINNSSNNQTAYEQSLKYHYAVGSKAKCNTASAGIGYEPNGGNAWIDCTITGASDNNIYYDVSFYNPGTHKQETDNVQIQYVSNK